MKPIKTLIERIEALEKQNGPVDLMTELRRLVDKAILDNVENREKIVEMLDSIGSLCVDEVYIRMKLFLESLHTGV